MIEKAAEKAPSNLQATESRKVRLAEALRANLKRRKEAARRKKGGDGGASGGGAGGV
jgi:hypothetical protein